MKKLIILGVLFLALGSASQARADVCAQLSYAVSAAFNGNSGDYDGDAAYDYLADALSDYYGFGCDGDAQ